MKLYYAPGTCAMACWISLEWAGADYQVEKADASSAAYQKINPLGMVPALDIGGPRAMTEADAILQYIIETHPGRDLGPDAGAEARLEFNEAMSFLGADLHPAFWPFFFPQRYTTATDETSHTQVREAAYLRIDRNLAHLDRMIGDTGHVYRAKRTVLDPYAFVMARWSEKIPKTWREYPHLAAFMTRLGQDAAVQSVLKRA